MYFGGYVIKSEQVIPSLLMAQIEFYRVAAKKNRFVGWKGCYKYYKFESTKIESTKKSTLMILGHFRALKMHFSPAYVDFWTL